MATGFGRIHAQQTGHLKMTGRLRRYLGCSSNCKMSCCEDFSHLILVEGIALATCLQELDSDLTEMLAFSEARQKYWWANGISGFDFVTGLAHNLRDDLDRNLQSFCRSRQAYVKMTHFYA